MVKFRSIVGLVVEFVVAIDEARVRFTDDAFFFCLFVSFKYCICDTLTHWYRVRKSIDHLGFLFCRLG